MSLERRVEDLERQMLEVRERLGISPGIRKRFPERGDPPLVAHWNNRGWDAEWQLDRLREDEHWLPTFKVPWPWQDRQLTEAEVELAKLARERGLPVSVVSSQPEGVMQKNPPDDSAPARYRFRDLPFSASPNLWRISTVAENDPLELNDPPGLNELSQGTLDGLYDRVRAGNEDELAEYIANLEIDDLGEPLYRLDSTPILSAMGAVAAWEAAADYWTLSGWVQQLAGLCEGLDLLWVSNHEAALPKWHQYGWDLKWMAHHGELIERDAMEAAASPRWELLYTKLLAAMTANLQPFGRIRLIGYGMGSHRFSTYNRLVPENRAWGYEHAVWDGQSQSYYLNPWSGTSDYQVKSVMTEDATLLPVNDWRREQGGDWFHELSVWHGDWKGIRSQWKRNGSLYTPERYEGFVKFGIYLFQPQVVREFLKHTHEYDQWVFSEERLQEFQAMAPGAVNWKYSEFYEALDQAVVEFHEVARLRRALKGELVTEGIEWPRRMYLDAPLEVPRFLLRCSANPLELKRETDLPVQAMARRFRDWELGEPAGLILAWAPLGPVTTSVWVGEQEIPDVVATPQGTWVEF